MRFHLNLTNRKLLLLSYASVSQNVWNACQLISENDKCLKPIFGKAIYLKTTDVSIKAYWYLKTWGDLRLRLSILHGSCSCDGCWHEVVTSVSSDVLNKLPQTAVRNWHIFFPTITSTSTWIKSVTLKLEVVHSCKTLELAMLILQCKNQKYNHINEFNFHIWCKAYSVYISIYTYSQ
jgi:hypothetical protein